MKLVTHVGWLITRALLWKKVGGVTATRSVTIRHTRCTILTGARDRSRASGGLVGAREAIRRFSGRLLVRRCPARRDGALVGVEANLRSGSETPAPRKAIRPVPATFTVHKRGPNQFVFGCHTEPASAKEYWR